MLRWAAVAALVTVALTGCDPKDQEPITKPHGVIEHRRQPCGADGICQPGEVKCWQLQIRTPGGTFEYRCVSTQEWNKYPVGSTYP